MLQEMLIDKVKEKAASDAHIEAVLMYGSFTQGAGDRYSDVEFYVFYDPPEEGELPTREWIDSIHPIYADFHNEYGTEVVIFTNLIRGEFHFLPAAEMSIIASFVEAGYFPDLEAMCLYDRSGRLWQELQALRDPGPDRHTAENAGDILDNLINYTLYGINVHKRGEHARSLECLFMAQRLLAQALRLTGGSVEHWLNPLKAFEQEIGPEAYEVYRQCTAALDPPAIQAAYQAILSATKDIDEAFSKRYHTPERRALLADMERYFLEST